MLDALIDGLQSALTPPTVYWLLGGTLIGLVVGFLPAIGAIVGVVLFLPFTYGMDLATAVVFLVTIYATGQYGDSITSIMLNTPGGPGTVASCWEGYPMTRRGEGARALGISAFGSMVGGLAGCFAMVALAWPLTDLALKIGPPEYFALGVMALGLISIASRGETLKGLIMGCLGIALSFIGADPVTAVTDRFAFGSVHLAAGIPSVSVFVGIFAIAQIIRMFEERGSTIQEDKKAPFKFADVFSGFWDVLKRPFTVCRSIFVGIYIGILPALGVTTATVTSYLIEKKYSPEREQFGQGAPSGLVAAEVSKGCCVVGDMIPTFMLGIPGSPAGAIIMAAFLLHGVDPGPQFLTSGSAPYIVFAGIACAQLIIVLAGLPLIKLMGSIVLIPTTLLTPTLAVLCFLGAFIERNLVTDILFLTAFGIFGYVLDRLKYSTISLIIGLIVAPLMETNFHRTWMRGSGSLELFWTRPLTVAFFAITLLFLAWPYIKTLWFFLTKGNSMRPRLTRKGSDVPEVRIGEIILLGALAIFGLAMLIYSKGYPFQTRLFPVVTCCAMLTLIGWRGGVLFLRGAQVGPMRLRKPWLLSDSMSWEWSLGSLIGYYLLIQAVGFLGATATYFVAVPALLRYSNKFTILIVAGLCTLSVALVARALHLVLPTPFWY